MKTKYAKNITKLLIMAIVIMAFSPLAFAAEEKPSLELPVKISFKGSPPATQKEYTIVLEADNPDYPMPEASKDGKFNFMIEGDSTKKIPRIEFSKLGVYTYKIYQAEETDETVGYDPTIYNLVVYVTNAEDGSGLETTVILYLLGETEKLDEIVFRPNPKQPPVEKEPEKPVTPTKPVTPEKPRPQAPKTGDDTNQLAYMGLFASGIGLLLMLAVTRRNKK